MRRRHREAHWYYSGGVPTPPGTFRRRWRSVGDAVGRARTSAVVHWRSTVATVVLVAAVCVLGVYANPSGESADARTTPPVPSAAGTGTGGTPRLPVDHRSRPHRVALPDTARSPHPPTTTGSVVHGDTGPATPVRTGAPASGPVGAVGSPPPSTGGRPTPGAGAVPTIPTTSTTTTTEPVSLTVGSSPPTTPPPTTTTTEPTTTTTTKPPVTTVP